MQFTTAAIATALFSAGAFAQEQSAPFNLTVSSADGKYNGNILTSCHEGAAIESLCLGYSGSTFNQNYTSSPPTGSNGNGPLGYLVWFLPSQPTGESEALTFFTDPSTNVALPLFEPTENPQYLAFDSENLLNIPSALNDKVTPPTFNTSRPIYSWYICESNYEGYVEETLNWVWGSSPQNPSCDKVDVKRVFI